MLKSLGLYLIPRLNGKVFFGTNFEIFHNFGPIGEKTTGMPKLIMKWNLIRPSSSIIPEIFVFGQEDLAEKNDLQVTKKSCFFTYKILECKMLQKLDFWRHFVSRCHKLRQDANIGRVQQ